MKVENHGQFWVVMTVHPFEELTIEGKSCRVMPGDPTHFLPVFFSREEALEWAGEDAEVMKMTKLDDEDEISQGGGN